VLVPYPLEFLYSPIVFEVDYFFSITTSADNITLLFYVFALVLKGEFMFAAR
jgi:hypothetical protein